MKILVAEDDIITLKLIEKFLAKWGYESVCVADGNAAWNVINSEKPPRMMVLDWVMPGIDGVTLCKKIRELKLNGYIYIIFLTGRSEERDIVAGLEAGADDYMLKPFKPGEFKSRLDVGMRILQYENSISKASKALADQNEALERYSRIMETLAEERARQLVRAERLVTLGEMSAGIAHEMNNYLTPVTGYSELLAYSIKNTNCITSEDFKKDCLNSIDSIMAGAGRIKKLVERIRKSSRKDGTVEKAAIDLRAVILQSAEFCSNRLRKLRYIQNLPQSLPLVFANAQEIEQVFVNILKNAAEAIEDTNGNSITLSASVKNDFIVATIEDDGSGIPAEVIDKIFDAFYTTKGPEKGTGLGLSICRGIIESYGGTIKAENRPEGGARFIISLPVFKSVLQ